MRVLVIGLGSMGKRRIRLLKKIDENICIWGVDRQSERLSAVQKEFGIHTCSSLEQALQESQAECAVVSTSPLSHGEVISHCLAAGLHVFTEINLVSEMYHENMKLAKEKGRVLFLSSTFLYRKEIQFLQSEVCGCREKVNYTYHVGQYLPDWHPWEKYENFFVGDSRTNGCRELFAIEFPWLVYVFGKIVSIQVKKSRNSQLHIDYPDNYLVLIEHEDGHKGMFAVDVISRKPVRNLEVYGEHLYLTWNGAPDGLRRYNIRTGTDEDIDLYEEILSSKEYAPFIIENAYENELVNFFGTIEGTETPRYSFEQDEEILRWIDQL